MQAAAALASLLLLSAPLLGLDPGAVGSALSAALPGLGQLPLAPALELSSPAANLGVLVLLDLLLTGTLAVLYIGWLAGWWAAARSRDGEGALMAVIAKEENTDFSVK